jgi:hypothetical protein
MPGWKLAPFNTAVITGNKAFGLSPAGPCAKQKEATIKIE